MKRRKRGECAKLEGAVVSNEKDRECEVQCADEDVWEKEKAEQKTSSAQHTYPPPIHFRTRASHYAVIFTCLLFLAALSDEQSQFDV
jgi:hypothetical protein